MEENRENNVEKDMGYDLKVNMNQNVAGNMNDTIAGTGNENMAGNMGVMTISNETESKKSFTFTMTDMIAGILILALGYMFIRFTLFSIEEYSGWTENYYAGYIRIGTGCGMTLFTICYAGMAEWYAQKKQVILSKKTRNESYIWLAFLCLQAMAYAIIPRASWTEFYLAGLFATAVYWTMIRFGAISNEQTSDYVIYDFIATICMCLPGRFFCRDRAIVNQLTKNKKSHPAGQVLIGGLFAAPVLVVAYVLLCQIEPEFGNLISFENLFGWIQGGMIVNMMNLFFGYFVANYIFALFYYLIEKRKDEKRKSTIVECTGKYGFLSMTSVATIFILVISLYLIFFVMQTRYLFLAFSNRLPATFTYAEYARRGFFELCAICVLNLSLLLACHLFCKTVNKKLMRVLSIGIYSCSILFLVIAFRKMLLYITTYGLTHKRIATCWIMVLIAVIIITGIVREFRRFPMLRVITLFAAFWFTALSFANVDGMIAKNQIMLYESGKIDSIDYDLLDQCQVSALPYIEEQIARERDSDTMAKLQKLAKSISKEYSSDCNWWELTAERMKVK